MDKRTKYKCWALIRKSTFNFGIQVFKYPRWFWANFIELANIFLWDVLMVTKDDDESDY